MNMALDPEDNSLKRSSLKKESLTCPLAGHLVRAQGAWLAPLSLSLSPFPELAHNLSWLSASLNSLTFSPSVFVSFSASLSLRVSFCIPHLLSLSLYPSVSACLLPLVPPLPPPSSLPHSTPASQPRRALHSEASAESVFLSAVVS